MYRTGSSLSSDLVTRGNKKHDNSGDEFSSYFEGERKKFAGPLRERNVDFFTDLILHLFQISEKLLQFDNS